MFKKSLFAILALIALVGAGGVAKQFLSHKLEG